MSRLARLDAPGVLHHIIIRGIERRKILIPKLSDFFAKKCAKILMQQGLRKAQAYQWICRDFSQVLDAQEIGAGRVKNRSI